MLVLASLGVLLTLTLGVVASTIFALREHAALKESERQSPDGQGFDGCRLAPDGHGGGTEPTRMCGKAAKLVAEQLDEGHIKTPEANAQLRTQLGKIYFNLSDYALSRDQFSEAYRIASEKLGEKDTMAMTALDQRGKAYISLGDYAKARDDLQKAHQLQVEVLGPENEDTVHTYAKLGDLFWKMEELNEAEKRTTEVLKTRTRLWGPKYRFTLVSMNSLALIFRDQKRYEEARALFEEAAKIASETLGEDHPSTLSYMHNHALALTDLNQLKDAEDRLSKCLARRQLLLGDTHDSTLKTEQALGVVLHSQGEHEEARKRFESIDERLRAKQEVDPTFRGVVLLRLGQCLTSLGKSEEAEVRLKQAKALLLKKAGPTNKWSRETDEALAQLRSRKPGAR